MLSTIKYYIYDTILAQKSIAIRLPHNAKVATIAQ